MFNFGGLLAIESTFEQLSSCQSLILWYVGLPSIYSLFHSKTLLFELINIGAYVQLLSNLDKFYLRIQEIRFRHVYLIWNNLAKIGPYMFVAQAALRAPVGAQSPGPSLLVNCYLEIKFNKK